MKSITIKSIKTYLIAMLLIIGSLQIASGQEIEAPEISSNNTYHNQLFFNRFLINPTFSLVRENKSYLNILHRNQYATFDDNIQNYFIGFSNKINDNSAFGIGIYSQWSGVVQEFGFNANYATAVQLGEKSKLTFGANVTYFNEGLDKNRVIGEESDTKLLKAKKESKLAIQPAITLSLGNFDFGIYAKDLVKYNQTTNEFSTSFNKQSAKVSLQYTHSFNTTRGLFSEARLMPLVQIGENLDGSLSYIGSLLLDLPKYGWLQSTIDDNYGLSMGLGFNLSNKMSLGYLLEKDVMQDKSDLGWNHELSLAYTFENHGAALTANSKKSNDHKVDGIIRNYEEQILSLIENQKNAKNKSRGQIDAIIKKYEARIASLNKKQTKNAPYSTENPSSNDLNNTLAQNEEENNLKEVTSSTFAQVESNIQNKFNDIVKNFESESITLNAPKVNKSNKNKKTRHSQKRSKTKTEGESEANTNSLAYQNRLILDELILRQDSIEIARTQQLEKKFETIVRILRSDLKQNLKSTKEVSFSVPKTAISNNATKNSIKKEALKFNEIPLKVIHQNSTNNIKSGYYVIANVYKTKKYKDAFMKDLRSQGIEAKQFHNKENGLYYVYIADFNHIKDAEIAFASNLNGKYSEDKWILRVDKPTITTSTAANIYED